MCVCVYVVPCKGIVMMKLICMFVCAKKILSFFSKFCLNKQTFFFTNHQITELSIYLINENLNKWCARVFCCPDVQTTKLVTGKYSKMVHFSQNQNPLSLANHCWLWWMNEWINGNKQKKIKSNFHVKIVALLFLSTFHSPDN